MNIQPLYSAFDTIAQQLRNNDIMQLGADTKNTNTSDDIQKNIDILANNIIVDAIKKIPDIIGYISEEEKNIIFTTNDEKRTTGLIIGFDPLDGSTNVLSNLTIGTIYGIYNYDRSKDKLLSIEESGYCLYGPSTILVKTVKKETKKSVVLYHLDDSHSFSFVKELSLSKKNTLYAINMSYDYDKDIYTILNEITKSGCTQRWVGAMVADCHQVLMRGGTFLYPKTTNKPNGKIRLLYEALPIAHIFTTLGGIAIDINYRNILEFIPYIKLNNIKIHQEIPIILSTFYTNESIETLLEINDIIKC